MKKHSGIQLSLILILGTMGLFLKTQAQNSGIGTNTPASRLHVVGSTSNSSTSSFQVQNSTSPTPLIFVRDDGKVGIGTNSPTYRFQVNGRAINTSINEYGQVAAFQDTTGNFKTFFSLNTAAGSWSPLTALGDNGIFWTDDGVVESNNGFIIAPHSALTKGIRIDGLTGNFHVGANAYKAVLGGLAASTNLGYGTSYLGFNLSRSTFQANTWSTGSDLYNNGGGVIYGDMGGGIRIATVSSVPGIPGSTAGQTGITDATVAGNTKLYIRQDGFIGVGTTTPGSLLSIANGASDPLNYGKAFQITNANGASQQMAFIRAGNNIISAGYKGTNSIWGFGGGQTNDASFAPNYLSFDVSVAGTNGYIGIGNSAPTAPLHVNKGNYGCIYLGDNTTTGHHITHEPSDNSLTFWSGTFPGGTARIKLLQNGNVGIGTTSPQYKLEATGDIFANNGVLITSRSVNEGGAVSIYTATKTVAGTNMSYTIYNMKNGAPYNYGDKLSIWGYPSSGNGQERFSIWDNGDFTFLSAASAERVRITNAGNLGIGTTAPTTLLHVKNGHIRSEQTTIPTIVLTTSNGLTTPAITAGSSDTKGQITMQGSISASTNAALTITFNTAYTVAPTIVVTPTNAAGQNCSYYVVASTTGFVFYFKGSVGTGAVGFNYVAIE